MSVEMHEAVALERLAWEAFLLHIGIAARNAGSYTIPARGDGSGDAVRVRVDAAFIAHGIDLFGWHQPAPVRTALTASERQAVFDRDGRRCRWCGATENLTIDHIHPVSYGGTNALGNLQVLCASCNSWKSDRRPQP